LIYLAGKGIARLKIVLEEKRSEIVPLDIVDFIEVVLLSISLWW
jgi:hypothetical protein